MTAEKDYTQDTESNNSAAPPNDETNNFPTVKDQVEDTIHETIKNANAETNDIDEELVASNIDIADEVEHEGGIDDEDINNIQLDKSEDISIQDEDICNENSDDDEFQESMHMLDIDTKVKSETLEDGNDNNIEYDKNESIEFTETIQKHELLEDEESKILNKQMSMDMREFIILQKEESIKQREQMLNLQEKMNQEKEIYLLEREEAVELREIEVSYREEELKLRSRPSDHVDDAVVEIDDNDGIHELVEQHSITRRGSDEISGTFEYIDNERLAQQLALQQQQIDYLMVKEEALNLREMSVLVREEALEKEKKYVQEREEQLQRDIEEFEQNHQQQGNTNKNPLNNSTKLSLLSKLTDIQKEKNESIERKVLELKNREELLQERLSLLENMKSFSSKRNLIPSDNDTQDETIRKFEPRRITQSITKIIRNNSIRNTSNNNNHPTNKQITSNHGEEEDEIDKMLKLKQQKGLNTLQGKNLVSDLLETDVYKINVSIKEKEIELRKYIKAKGQLLRKYNDGKIGKEELDEKLVLVKNCVEDAKEELRDLQDRKMAAGRR